MATGEPRWLAVLDLHAASLIAHKGLAVCLALAGLLGLVALGVFLPNRWPRYLVILAGSVSVVAWVFTKNLGGLFTGSATDPNSGRLPLLISLAYWPRVSVVDKTSLITGHAQVAAGAAEG